MRAHTHTHTHTYTAAAAAARATCALRTTSAHRVARVPSQGDVIGHGYLVGAGRAFDGPRITHTMDSVAKGDVLKLFSATTKAPVGSFVVSSVRWLRGAAIPDQSKTSWANRVHPDAFKMFEVTFLDCAACGAGPQPLSALVQIDKFASFGGVVRDNYFHDSYNNAARAAATDLRFENNTVERCLDGVHVSYDISTSFLEGSLGMRNLSFTGNRFLDVGSNPGEPSAHRCGGDNISCVLSHVDPELAPQVHAHGNTVSDSGTWL